MKRKVLFLSLVFAAVLTVYTAYAFIVTRGLKVYLISTRLGKALVSSWQITLLMALIFWIPVLVSLIKKVSSKIQSRRSRKTSGQIAAEEAIDTVLLRPRAASADEDTEYFDPNDDKERTDLISPRAGIKEDDTDLLNSRPAARVPDTDLLNARPGDDNERTRWMGSDSGMEDTELTYLQASTEAIKTELVTPPTDTEEESMPVPSSTGATSTGETVAASDVVQNNGIVEMQRPSATGRKTAIRYCPNCGHVVTGKKFCPECGTRIVDKEGRQ